MNVHYRSRPHKKGYGVLLSLQVCSCKSARLGVVRVTAEEGQGYSPSAHCHTPSHFRGDRGGLAARVLDRESEGLEHVERLQFTTRPASGLLWASPFPSVKWAFHSPPRGGCEGDSSSALDVANLQ